MNQITAKGFPSRLGVARTGLLVGALFMLGLPQSAKADTVYTYTGSADTYCSGTYASSGTTCAGTDALSITFDTPLTGINLVDGYLSPYVASFTITDGTGLSITNLTGGANFYVSTNNYGMITAWSIYAESDSVDPYYQAHTSNTLEYNIPFTYSYDYSTTDSGQNPESGQYSSVGEGASSLPGSWTETTSPGTGVFTIPTPEPATGILMLVGVGFVLVVRKRIVKRPPQAT